MGAHRVSTIQLVLMGLMDISVLALLATLAMFAAVGDDKKIKQFMNLEINLVDVFS